MTDPQTSSAAPTREFLARVGEQVRRRRKGAGMTVQQLADAADLSRRMLTQIELGQANPSLVTVDKIAAALGTDFVALAQDTPPGVLSVNAPGSTAGVWASPAGSRAALQIATHRHPPAELWTWVLAPGDRYEANADPPGSEELLLVREGTLTLHVEDADPAVITAGTAARLASDRTYAYVNDGEEPVEFVRVVQLGR